MTKKPAHTPGPWTCTQTSNHAHDYRLHAPTSPMPFEGNDVARANAHLIAAAPELLECAILAKEFEQHAGGAHLPAAAWFELHKKLDAAIAKATGQAA